MPTNQLKILFITKFNLLRQKTKIYLFILSSKIFIKISLYELERSIAIFFGILLFIKSNFNKGVNLVINPKPLNT